MKNINFHTDPPRITSAGPDRLTTAPLYTPAAFDCIAEGNPAPTYKWVQRYVHIQQKKKDADATWKIKEKNYPQHLVAIK